MLVSKYIFTLIKTCFSEIFLCGFHFAFVRKRIKSLTTQNLFYHFKLNTISFFNYYQQFAYLVLLFCEFRRLNQYILYVTSFGDLPTENKEDEPIPAFEDIRERRFAFVYNHCVGNYNGLANQSFVCTPKEEGYNEDSLVRQRGLILNFSTYFHVDSALRYFRSTENVVASINSNRFVDFAMFNNRVLSNEPEFVLYKFFQKIGSTGGDQNKLWLSFLTQFRCHLKNKLRLRLYNKKMVRVKSTLQKYIDYAKILQERQAEHLKRKKGRRLFKTYKTR